ncbi:MAG: glycosyltransferase family 2 protein [Chloroflexi bacterium]|nr:glycosyltransferase family 2 protein [Chloroflexota bacterium]
MSSPDRLPPVCVVILNWNNAAYTLRCLRSVTEAQYPDLTIIVVDNGSTDSSVAAIRERYPQVHLLALERNLGYAGGNNAGIQHALGLSPRYIFLLNNDVTIAPDALRHLVTAAEQHPEAAFLGPKIYHLDHPDRIQSAGATLDLLWRSHQRGLDEPDEGQFDKLEEVDYVIGAAVLIRAAALSQVGLLDDRFFLYREDVDWCLRARRLGYKILYVPQARVWHRSHHVRADELPRTTYYMTRNSLMLIAKHRGGIARLSAVLLRHLLTALTWTLRPKWRGKKAERDALIRGIIDFFRGRTGQGYE